MRKNLKTSSKTKKKRLPERYRSYVIDNLRKFMQEKGINQKTMAKAMGFTEGNLSQVLTGLRDITVGMLIKYKELYGLSIDKILFGEQSKPKEFIAKIEVAEKDRYMIGETEGIHWIENFVPIPIAKGETSGGPLREIREDPDGVAIIYKHWANNNEDFMAVWIDGNSMEPTIPHGSLVGIDRSKSDIRLLDNKIVAIRKDESSTIKRLKVVSNELVYGLPDNRDRFEDLVILRGEEIDTAIIGKVAWWWGKQE